MRGWLAFLIVAVGLAVPAAAQDPITGYEFRIYAPNATAPQIITPVPLANVSCNLVKATVTSNTNPTMALWDDPVNVGKDCRWIFSTPAPGPVLALPSGPYSASLVALNSSGLSAESALAPFTRERVPAAPTAVRITR